MRDSMRSTSRRKESPMSSQLRLAISVPFYMDGSYKAAVDLQP
jgi:hypothetical protein